jgi:putative nucleotidyltransferase with HDIG domain
VTQETTVPPTETLPNGAKAVATASGLAPRAITEAAERLAAPSPVVVGVLRMLDDGAAPARSVSAQLAASPELTVHVLRLANSAMFGQQVDSLERAVVRIGERTLRALLLAASTYRLMEGPLPIYGTPRLALFHHSTEVAQMAQAIARRQSNAYASQAYLAGLLHDLGKPIIAGAAAGRVSPDVRIAHGDVAAERGTIGGDHAQVGGWIAKRWSLSPDIAEALEHHHDTIPPSHPVARAVWLADVVAWAANGDEAAIERLPDAAQSCGMGTDVTEQVLATTQGAEAPRRPPGLTDRETQVLRMLAEGRTAKQVAHELGCSPSTIHNHLHHVYRKLDVSGQSQALLLAREKGWV